MGRAEFAFAMPTVSRRSPARGTCAPCQPVWAPPEAWRAKLGSCLLTGMLGSEARLARFLWMAPMWFLRGLLIPVGTDRVPLPRRGRRPVEAKTALAWSWFCLSPQPSVLLWKWAQEQTTGEQVWLPVQAQDREGGELWPPVPSFVTVLLAARLWDVSSLPVSSSSTLCHTSASFFCFSRIFSWADLEMVTWICTRSRSTPLPWGHNCAFQAVIHSVACPSLSGNKQADKGLAPS